MTLSVTDVVLSPTVPSVYFPTVKINIQFLAGLFLGGTRFS